MVHDEYRAIDAVNWSSLKSLRKSPLQYWHDRAAGYTEGTPAMRLGTLIHALILEPHVVDSRFAIYPGKARRGKAWESFVEENPGREIVLATEMTRGLRAADAVRQHPLAFGCVFAGEAEQVVTWTDPETGIKCKARTDLVNGKLVELKSTGDVTPRTFATVAARLGYHGQIAFYLDGLTESGRSVAPEPLMVVVESDEPYDVAVFTVPEEELETGRCMYRRLLHRLKDCTEADSWPGVCNEEPLPLALPVWAFNEENEPDLPITCGGVALEV